MAFINQLPDSPRYLAQVGKYNEAWDVLTRARGSDSPEVKAEFDEIIESTKSELKDSVLI